MKGDFETAFMNAVSSKIEGDIEYIMEFRKDGRLTN